jgi:hypothetical protein
MNAYVLVGPKGGRIHVATVADCLRSDGLASTFCDRTLGEHWRIVRSYIDRGITARRATCQRCRKALSSKPPRPKKPKVKKASRSRSIRLYAIGDAA